ncbi:MAG: MFS transporter [Actinomycetota bacterium]
MVGTTIEFFDFYVYATASVLVFPQLFFPKVDPTTALLASLATFGLAFVARPLGSVVLGHFGDRRGRKATLVASLLMMGVATFAIGLLPTYQQIGIFAPLALAVLRFTQGIALGGEWSGAALLATESSSVERRGWAAMWPQLGAPVGFLLANGSMLVLLALLGGGTPGQKDLNQPFYEWGWRVPFLASAVMVAFGLYVRLKLTETPVFQRAIRRGESVKAPLAELLRRNWTEVVVGTLAVVSTFTIFYVVTTWMLGYGTAARDAKHGLGIGFLGFLQLQLVAVLFFAASVPVAGRLIDRFGRRRVLIGTSIGIIAYGFCFDAFLSSEKASTTGVLVFLIIGMVLVGLAYGPLGAVLPELFPTNVRYTGSGIAFNLAGILGAAVAPFIATWLTVHHGVAYVGYYLVGSAVITLIAQVAMRETREVSLDSTAQGSQMDRLSSQS